MINYFEEIQKRLTRLRNDVNDIKLIAKDPRTEECKAWMYEVVADYIKESVDFISELLNYCEQEYKEEIENGNKNI
jgi:hypothetical protein